MATGMSGKPEHPDATPGADVFRGEQHHSSQHPGPGRLRGQEGRRDRLRTTPRIDICGALWEHGADVTMVQRSSTHIVKSDIAHGHRRSATCTRSGRSQTGIDHREGRPDLRLAALQDHARVPDPAVRADGASATPTSTTRLEAAGFRPRLGRRRLGAVHEVPAPRLGLLHRRRRRGAGRRTAASSSPSGAGRPPDRASGGPRRRHRAAGRPGRLRHRLRLDERLGWPT